MLFARTEPEAISFKDKDGDTTTVLKIGKKENRRCTVALSAKEKNKDNLATYHFITKVPVIP